METITVTPFAGTGHLNPYQTEASRHDLGDKKTGFVIQGIIHQPGTRITDSQDRTYTVLSASPNGSQVWYVTR